MKRTTRPIPPGYNPNSAWDQTYVPQPPAERIRSHLVKGYIFLFGGIPLFLLLAFWMLVVMVSRYDNLYWSMAQVFALCALVCGVAGGVFILLSRGPTRPVPQPITRDAYQRQIVLPELSLIFQNPAFHHQYPLLHTALLYDSSLVGYRGMPFETDDWLTGVYNGHPFITADIHTRAPTVAVPRTVFGIVAASATALAAPANTAPVPGRFGDPRRPNPFDYGEHTITMSEFRGRWLYFNTKQPMRGHVVVWSKGFEDLGSRRTIARTLQPVTLDNTALAPVFDVYSNHMHTAYRLLTPHVLEQLAGLVSGLQGNRVALGVGLVASGNCVQVLLYGPPNAFEPAVNPWHNTEANSRARVRGEAAVITTVINALQDFIR